MPLILPKVRSRSVLPILVTALGVLLSNVAAPVAAAGASTPVYTGSYIVRWRDGVAVDAEADTARIRRVESNIGLSLSVKRPMSGTLQLLSVKDAHGEAPEAIAMRLRNDPRVADAVPDRWLRLHDTTPNDPDLSYQSPYMGPPTNSLGGANLLRAWDRSRGSASIVVAVVASGYLPHPDLVGRIVAGYDFITSTSVSQDGDGRDADPTDPGDYVPSGTSCGDDSGPSNSTWHGTRVASVLGAMTNNGQDIAGVDWNARIQPVRGSGRCGALLSDTIDGMRWAGGLSVPNVPPNPTPARVINISLGGGTCSSIEQQTVNDLNAAGVVVVAATGNSAGAVAAPADCAGVIAVTAHANDGENASYANVGPEVAISAPGGGCGNSRVSVSGGVTTCMAASGQSYIFTLSNSGAAGPTTYVTLGSQGTSFAAPMVSGVVSMMLAVNPSLTPAQITTMLKSTARPHPTNTYCTTGNNAGTCGAGLLDADGALAAASAPVTPVPPSTPTPPPSSGSGNGDNSGSGGGGGGGAFAPWSAVALLVIGVAGFAGRRRTVRQAKGSCKAR